MRTFVIIATKGRAQVTRRLLDCLQGQTLQPDYTVIVGTEPSDVAGLDSHRQITAGRGEIVLSPRTGLTAQRNFGLEFLERNGHFTPDKGRFFCAFFDDDYRPAKDWLEQANRRFDQGDIVGLTGKILADGVKRGGLTEEDATDFLNGSKMPEAHWAGGAGENDTPSVYGCNMAFTDTVLRSVRFDEALPLYSWQEDRDYTGMARRLGRVIYFSGCRGVHLGVSSGRVSGVKFGYSQIANPVYLLKKGTMDRKTGARFMARALAINTFRGILGEHPFVDYRGRLRGNLRAVRDWIYGRLDPRRIADSNF